MSNFLVGINNLNTIFTSRNDSDPKIDFNTNLIYNNKDLSEIFYPYQTGSIKAQNTNYKVYFNNVEYDLSDLFQNINENINDYTISPGENTIITYGDNNKEIFFDIDITNNNIQKTGTTTITFNNNASIYFSVTSGGGYGGFYNTQKPNYGGGGGGGAETIISTQAYSVKGECKIIVGNGSKDYTNYSSGYKSSLTLPDSTSFSPQGGSYGQSSRFNGSPGTNYYTGGYGASPNTSATEGTIGKTFTICNKTYTYGSGGPGGASINNQTIVNYPSNNGNSTYGDGGRGSSYVQGDSQSTTNYTIGQPGRVIICIE